MSYTCKKEGEEEEEDMFGCMGVARQTFSLKISVPLGSGGRSSHCKVMKV